MRFLLLNILLIFLLLPVKAEAVGVLFDINAAGNFTDGDDDDETSTFSKLCGKKLIKPNKITGNIVRCANKIISRGGDIIISNYVKSFSSIVFYAVMLSILFFGIQMMYGVARKEVTFMMVIKITAVLFVCGPEGYLFLKNTRNALIGFPKAIASSLVATPSGGQTETVPNEDYDPQATVAPYNQQTITRPKVTLESGVIFGLDVLGVTNLLCKPDGTTSAGTPCPTYRMETIYDKFDETIMRTFGVKEEYITGAKKDEKTIETFMGLVVLAAGLFFTGGWGALFAIELFILVTATLFAIAQLALFFLVVAVAINVLVAIAPIAMACMLFKSTENITRKWFVSLLSYSIQPVILVVFMVVTVAILDSVSKEIKKIKIYEKVEMNILNADGATNTRVSVFNCLGASSSTDSATNKSSDKSNYDSLLSQFQKQAFSNSILSEGKTTAAGQTDTSKAECDTKAFAFTVDDTGVSSNPNQIQGADLRKMTAYNLAIIIIHLIMLSFVKQMPSIIARMTNAGGIDVATSIATNPTDKFVPSTLRKTSEAGRGFLRGF